METITSDIIKELISAINQPKKKVIDPDKPKVDSFKFDKIAKEILDHLIEGKQYPLSYKGDFYLYSKTQYVLDTELNDIIRTWHRENERPQSNNVVGNVAPIIMNMAHKPHRRYDAMPFYVGNDPTFPKPTDVIAFENGLLDLSAFTNGSSKELINHSPKWISTVCLPYQFNPEATCPTWLAFINQIYEGDNGRIDLLQEWLGYCLTQDTRYQKCLFLVGQAGSGKGTICRIVDLLVGSAYCTPYNLNSLAAPFGLECLIGKQVAIVGELELDQRSKRQILQTLNSIVGQDSQSINRKHKPEIAVSLPTRFILACNEMPTWSDQSGALARRALILNHDLAFGGTNSEDRDLGDKLAAEISGIANWALEGLIRLRKQGFTQTDSMKQHVADFRRNNAETLAFVQDRLVVERRLNPGNLEGVELTDKPLSISRADLLEIYQDWCVWESKEPNKEWLARKLKQLIPKSQYDRNAKVYSGFGILSANDREQEQSQADKGTVPNSP